MKYIIKDGSVIESIPVGRAKMTIGEKRNRLTLCDRGPTPASKKTKIICKCDCGNYIYINLQDFMNDKVQSCGCLRSEMRSELSKGFAKDYSLEKNNTNPFYEYISPTNIRWDWSHQVVWNIKCKKCGEDYLGIPTELISNERTHGMNPCECWKKYSIGVQKIISILQKNNIKYEQEKKYDTCVSPKGFKLPFDFYLPEYNILIEYDGEHHFKRAFGQSEEKLILQKQYDEIKNQWCKENNVKLIRIPYYQKEIKISDLGI